MMLGLLLASLLWRVYSTSTCAYYNQDTASVIVQENTQTVLTATNTITLNEGSSLSISCSDSTKSFEYNTPTTYTCAAGGSTVTVNLPICVDKCLKTQDLNDAYTTFLDENGADVTNTALAAYTPITIQCVENYAQQFGKSATQNCEIWDADASCKQMCHLSSYDTDTTRVLSNGRIDDYVRIGFDINVECIGSDVSLADGVASTITCSGSEDISVPSCTATCTVPEVPAGTTYHYSQDKLKEGQTFSVTCDANLKLHYETSDVATCEGADGFDAIPECKGTCTVTASGDSTIFDKDINGLLAEGESVRVSCANSNDLLPYGYETPYDLVCSSTQAFNIPICQSTCAEPDAPANAQLYRVSVSARLSLREPVQVACNDYYSFSDPQGSTQQNFYCTDTGADASVVIDKTCYVYAMLETETGAGTNKLYVKGEINNGEDQAGVSVQITVSNVNNGPTVTTSPNTRQRLEVASYQALNITVETTSQGSNVISRSYTDIYPGPPSPFVNVVSTGSNTVTIDLVKPADIAADILSQHLMEYIVDYNGNSIPTNNSRVILSNLHPATSYTVETRTKLSAAYGGEGSPASFPVYTGPTSVTSMSFVVQESQATISWSAVDYADQYKVVVSEHTTRTTSDTSLVIPNLDYGTTYNVSIVASRSVDSMVVVGDSWSNTMESGPTAPERSSFTVTSTGDSVTIVLEPSNDTGYNRRKRNADSYVVFLNNERSQTLTGDNVTIPLELSTNYEVKIAQSMQNDGYGEKQFLTNVKTADCGSRVCVNCKLDTYFDYVEANTQITVECSAENASISIGEDSDGNKMQVTQLKLTCDDKNQYVFTGDPSQIYASSVIECLDTEAIIAPTGADYTVYYILGGVGVFLVLVLLIIIVVLRKRRTQGTYNAKKVKESAKNGTKSPDVDAATPQAFVDDSAYFENRWSNELLATRAQSGRSKATSYGSQELRMEIADSDSGITEDLDHSFFNPTLYSSNYEDDAISTKSALV